jgi:hypothetical protein
MRPGTNEHNIFIYIDLFIYLFIYTIIFLVQMDIPVLAVCLRDCVDLTYINCLYSLKILIMILHT